MRKAARLALVALLSTVSVGAAADPVQAFGQASGPFPRYSLFTSSEGLFLLDQATGCVWKRFQSSAGAIAWNMELKVTNQVEARVGCYISLPEYNTLLMRNVTK